MGSRVAITPPQRLPDAYSDKTENGLEAYFFIDRPIFASVLSIIIVVLGLVSLQKLPIVQFPQITPPMVQIDADYPGASAEIVAEAVARPIEVQLPGIDNLLYYDSTSTNDGHMTMRLTFEIGTDVDIAQVQTQNRQRLAEPQLPDEVVRQGITVKKLAGSAGGHCTELHRSQVRHYLSFKLCPASNP